MGFSQKKPQPNPLLLMWGFLQAGRGAVLELVVCLHHLVMPAGLHKSSCLPETQVNPI